MKNTTLFKEVTNAFDYKKLRVTSTAFQNEGMIPFKYSCDGANTNPPLDIEDIPDGTRSLAIIFENRDTSSGSWAHWVVWNIPVMNHIKEYGMHGTEGMNDFHQQRYIGPVPSFDTYQYAFKIYALNSLIYLTPQETKEALEIAMSEHLIAYGEMIGLYKNNLANSFRDNITHHN
jgi:Raf kinase inhibitor-like YbhB/YbcL family protein